MLNPSTACEAADDPTVARCVRRGRDGGWGAIRVCNLFALRATHPAELKAHPAPEGEGNDDALDGACRWADAVVAAWGAHGAYRGKAAEVAERLHRMPAPVLHLGPTERGEPRHPLYVPYRVKFSRWRRRSALADTRV